jgi:hypothetical protein
MVLLPLLLDYKGEEIIIIIPPFERKYELSPYFICFSQEKILSLRKELVLRKLKGYVDVAHSVDFVGLFFCFFDKEVSFK